GVAGGEVTRSLNTAMQAATGFGTAMATAGKSVGAFGAIASGVTVGAVALTAALVKTNQELTDLKLRLMESDEAQIRRSQMALRSIGAGAEEAEGIMTRMSQFVFDSYRGVQSEMFGALEKFGPNATRIVDRARQMFHEEGRDMVEVQQYVVREISKFSPTVQRFIWQSLQIRPEIAMQWRDAQAKLPAVYQRSAEQAKVLSEQQQRLKQNYTNLTVAASNLWNRVKDNVLEFVLPKLNTVLEVMLKIIRLIPGTGGKEEDSEKRRKQIDELR